MCTNGFGSPHNPSSVTTLTQHDEVDLAPVVLSSSLDFTVVFPGVGQQQVTDQQGGVSTQVLAGKGQAAGLAAGRHIGVHLTPKEGDDLQTWKREENPRNILVHSQNFLNKYKAPDASFCSN